MWHLPICIAPTGSVIKELLSTVSPDKSGCWTRSHSLIVPSAEHVAKETPPEHPLAAHIRDGSWIFSQQRFLISHIQAE